MDYKEALELQNMFTVAAQRAKANNKYECHFEITEEELAVSIKKAFPHQSEAEALEMAKEILNEPKIS